MIAIIYHGQLVHFNGGLCDELVTLFASAVSAGEACLQAGQIQEHLYFLLSGRLEAVDHDGYTLAIFSAGKSWLGYTLQSVSGPDSESQSCRIVKGRHAPPMS